MSRADWLSEEIRADHEYAERYAGSDDAVERAQASRRLGDAHDKQVELDRLGTGARLSLRLTGGGIQHDNAPTHGGEGDHPTARDDR